MTDPEMNAAIAEARATLPQFITALDAPVADAVYMIKAEFVEGEDVEHMWVRDVSHRDGVFAGILANAPLLLGNLQAGQPVQVSPREISDWMIVGKSRYGGGFTQRVIRNRLSTAEQVEFDRAMGSPE